MAALRSVIWVSFPLLLCCYPRACTAPLRFRLGPSDPRLALRTLMRFPRTFAPPPSSVLRSILPHLVLVTALPPPLAHVLVYPPPSPRALPRASSLAALPPPPSFLIVRPWPSPSFLLPPLPPLCPPARPPPLPPLTHPQ
ncbi:hypothetical protein K438DRAFT_1870760 [Mycena galopus ATCC 62051]|nr:hypothetical protein K438DRAFT_1870760 [Mycena galopus ATCC 62051]